MLQRLRGNTLPGYVTMYQKTTVDGEMQIASRSSSQFLDQLIEKMDIPADIPNTNKQPDDNSEQIIDI